MRGKERDELVNDPRFQLFLLSGKNGRPSHSPAFLVATSAGEVGVNISADHLVCDLSTFDSMCQRFGRVNRFGDCLDTTITVFHETVFGKTNAKGELVAIPIDEARRKTLDILESLNSDASPEALSNVSSQTGLDAFTPPPSMRVATDIQFDAWSLTSILGRIAARPPVAPYLHGEADDWQPSETYLAWRDDRDFEHSIAPANFLELFPLKPRELLRDTTKRIVASLAKLTTGRESLPDAWLIDERGSVSPFSLSNFDKENAGDVLADATIVLPASLGGLSEQGLFDGKSITNNADVSGIERRESSSRERADLAIQISTKGEEAPRYLLWFAPKDGKLASLKQTDQDAVTLDDHQKAVALNIAAIASQLNLHSDLQAALINAAEHHDDGKARREWQLAIGNRNYPRTVLAKTAPDAKPRNLAENYRHEFGSLSSLTGLAAHCIAAHHGRARPYFPAEEIFDPAATPDTSAEIATQVPLRFATLQRKYGRWGLAYLESILRAADYAASAGIVAKGGHTPLVTSSQIGNTTLPPKEVNTVSLALDPANPGHFFACCGLFELASRAHPEATAFFDGNRFIIRAPTTLADLLGQITGSLIITLALDDATASPLFISEPFNLRIDWWKNAGTASSALKVWAGTMEAPRIAKAMQKAIDSSKGGEVLFDLRIAYDVADKTKKVEPFYFDANRGPNSDSRDVGFSPNDLGFETLAAPAVEFLCLVGLQRGIPQPAGNRLFDYHLWSKPIPVSLLAAAVNGIIQPEKHHVYRFESWYRTSQRKHKAFLTAKPINQGNTQ